ncbi:MAG: LuxR C-terminal-related transcriptional regulator, partial [Ideonella sp.]|nr:LuxR C-terminal-related transcriptional regulator [Ideonella sp.]
GALVVEHPGPARPASFISVGNTPEAFVTNYQNLADSLRDPVLRRMKHLSVPFLYDQDLYTEEDAGDLWEQQAAYGYRTGISVALHLPGHRHFLLGMDREQPLPRDERRLTRLFADLQLLAVHAQDAAQRLLAPLADREPVPRLTERELEVLRWTMDGKSAWAVGEILGISEHTVNFHLRNVFGKLGASSKHQAVLKALALGLI